jgi:hypothetical protein
MNGNHNGQLLEALTREGVLINVSVRYWRATKKLNAEDLGLDPANDPVQALEAIADLPENVIVLLKDFHQFLEDGNPVVVQQMKQLLRAGKTKGETLVIQIEKFGRESERFGLDQLARATDGLTSSEIEQVFIDALHEAFSRRGEPNDLSIAMLLTELVLLSRLMNEQIAGLRQWAKGRARLATSAQAGSSTRRILAGA